METIKSICVFCGSSNNAPKSFIEQGRLLGKMIAERKLHLVYGGGDCGIMGSVAGGVLSHGGTVTGVFPRVLSGLEEEHHGLTENILVDDMHTRKMTMFNRSDAFIVLPGGFGTMDETFEVITWKQLQTHQKPVVICNLNNYFDYWVELTDHFINKGFASQKSRKLYEIVDSLDAAFDVLFVGAS